MTDIIKLNTLCSIRYRNREGGKCKTVRYVNIIKETKSTLVVEYKSMEFDHIRPSKNTRIPKSGIDFITYNPVYHYGVSN